MHVPLSGVEYTPELEWRLAAKDFGYTWEQFCRLPGPQQSSIVAAYRADQRIRAIVDLDQAQRMSKRGKRGPR